MAFVKWKTWFFHCERFCHCQKKICTREKLHLSRLSTRSGVNSGPGFWDNYLGLKNLALSSNSVKSTTVANFCTSLRAHWCSHPSNSNWVLVKAPPFLRIPEELNSTKVEFKPSDCVLSLLILWMCTLVRSIHTSVDGISSSKLPLDVCISHPSPTCFSFILAVFNVSLWLTCWEKLCVEEACMSFCGGHQLAFLLSFSST